MNEIPPRRPRAGESQNPHPHPRVIEGRHIRFAQVYVEVLFSDGKTDTIVAVYVGPSDDAELPYTPFSAEAFIAVGIDDIARAVKLKLLEKLT